MSIYNLRPYIGDIPLVGGYNLGPYIGGVPLPIKLGVEAWYDFSNGSKIIEGATSVNVAGWIDGSGNGNDIEQLTPANQPTFNLPNGPIDFDGSNDFLIGLPTDVDAGDFTYMVKLSQDVRDRAIFGYSGDLVDGRTAVTFQQVRRVITRSQEGVIREFNFLSDIPLGSMLIFTLMRTSGVLSVQIDSEKSLDTHADAGLFPIDLLGKRSGLFEIEFDGSMENLQIYKRALTDPEVLAVINEMNGL